MRGIYGCGCCQPCQCELARVNAEIAAAKAQIEALRQTIRTLEMRRDRMLRLPFATPRPWPLPDKPTFPNFQEPDVKDVIGRIGTACN